MAAKADVVVYIDRASVAHNALVVGVNNLNPDVLDVTYFDLKADALKTEFGVPHMSDESKKESNPALPQYSLNCWKIHSEEHLVLPVDHPANDHPFEQKKQDDSGRLVAKPRPEYEKHIAEVSTAKDAKERGAETGANNADPAPVELPQIVKDAALEELANLQASTTIAEPDVTTQLDAAGPAPVVEEHKPPATEE